MSTRLLLLLSIAGLLGACAGRDTRSSAEGATFVVVRHAEKASSPDDDPVLDPAGLERARLLARELADQPVVAIYATGYRRTRQTAAPSAATFGLQVTTYDAKAPATALAAQLRAAHPRGTVLVAGHSNTVPDIVAALCGCDSEPMPETEYDRISTIRVDADGRASLRVARYGRHPPAP
ncbi:histidine phosphatase family protein [Luteimonas viscosa]|uniref:Histidine phosphatase family protein n=1 Tax=Luteimonas viscosa TaxID=1132694 RepID=A0A5D4XNE3_9GAMM|nr:phosphoglycerate mutase family protein [Luteimonas viscosa]TYT25453.1 histidine phosphatase family protein [Luteimonas viscosa]